MNIIAVQPSHQMNYQEQSSNTKSNKIVEEVAKSSESREIIDHRKLSDEEAKNLYYSLKENNLMKTKIDIYMNNQENDDNELDYSDIKELQETQNKMNLAEYSANNSNMQTEDTHFQVWA